MEWQQIETAPKDGSEIIITDGDECFLAHWEVETGRFEDYQMYYGVSITHWLPIPKLPKV